MRRAWWPTKPRPSQAQGRATQHEFESRKYRTHDPTAITPEAHHEHPEHLANHFESLQQQYDSGKLGIWLFLTTEILMFSGLFCGYAVLRALHPEIFLYAAPLPVRAAGRAEYGRADLQQLHDGLGCPCGAARPDQAAGSPAHDHAGLAFVFLGVKFVEYKNKWEEALLPGKLYNPAEPPPGVVMPSFGEGKEKAGEMTAKKPEKPAAAKPAAAPRCSPALLESDRRSPPRPSVPQVFRQFGLIAINSAAMSYGTARSRTMCNSSSASTSP